MLGLSFASLSRSGGVPLPEVAGAVIAVSGLGRICLAYPFSSLSPDCFHSGLFLGRLVDAWSNSSQPTSHLPFLKQHGSKDDQPFEDQLRVAVNIFKQQNVAQKAEDQHADERASHGSSAAHEVSPANHHGCDGIQLCSDAGVWLSLAVLCGVENTGQSCQHSRRSRRRRS